MDASRGRSFRWHRTNQEGAFMCDDCYYTETYEINKKNRDISSY